ncbi:MAG: glycosyltransferase [Candidatus Altiarchaeota archaeon]
MKDQPLVSIIIPAKNEQDHMDKLLTSLKDQKYGNFEVVIVDDASSDETPEIIKRFMYSSPYPLKLITHQKSLGAAKSRNDGIGNSIGEFIAFLDSDDRMNPEYLSKAVPQFSEDVAGIAPIMEYTKDTWVERGLVSILKIESEKIPLPHIWRRRDLKEIGNWDTKLGIGEDKDLHERIKEYCEKHDKRVVTCKECIKTTHVVHTLGELYRQHQWYGRGIYSFLRKRGNLKNATTLGKLSYPLVYIGPMAFLLHLPFSSLLLVISLPNIIFEIIRISRGVRNDGIYGFYTLILDGVKWFAFTIGLIEFILTRKKFRE